MDPDAKDYKISHSVQSQNKNNRIIHEYTNMDINTKDNVNISDTIMSNNSSTAYLNSQQPPSRSEKRKLMSEYDMWKYSYSLVKNGYSILAPEPSQRSRSYRDLILQEMNWMALDYYQERRWKSHIAKEISNSINTSIIDRKRLKRDWPSKQCSYNIETFWLKLKDSGEINGISTSLHEYCQRVVSGKTLKCNLPEIIEETPTKRSDLLAITVPVYKNVNTNSVNVAKNEVVNATLNHMLILGAELYPQCHRPPDDEIDVFTLPALNPKREFDYNTLMLMLHSLKSNMFPKMSKAEFKAIVSNIGMYKTHHPHPGLNSILPIRRIPRDEVDPFSLSVNYRDFLDNSPIHPIHMQKLVLKWEEPSLNESDFELLDSWMLKTKCWPLISIALNLRSSSGGLLRREFSPKACREAFYRISKTPRGLVNSSKKLLGPKQTKTILSFIDAPPAPFKFKLIVPPGNLLKAQAAVKTESPGIGVRTLFGDVSRLYRDQTKLYETTHGGMKESFHSTLKMAGDARSDRKLTLNEVQSECADAFAVPNNLKVELLSSNPSINLPVDLEDFMNCDGNMELFKRRDSDSSSKKESDGGRSTRNAITAGTRNRFVRLSETDFGVNHRFSSLNSVVTLATSLNSHDNVVRNLGYSELSTRMNKQLRIGFLGIPTKMFVYSLFYCGRIKPDFRVRRVALSISSISKFIPPPHLLYGKMFDPDINLILSKSRPLSYDKQRSKSVDSQDSFTNELVQSYSNEVSSYLKTKGEETSLPTLLATYAQVSLSRGKTCNQSCFSNKKILIVSSNYGSSANTSNSGSTPTERKRPLVNSFEGTPRQKTRPLVDITMPSETPPILRARPEPIIRRQIPHPHAMMALHPYQPMHMMYGMNQSMNQQITGINQPMSSMSQQINGMSQSMSSINQQMSMNQQMTPMNSHPQSVNSMPQPIKSMNNMNMMGMSQQMNAMNNLNSGMSNMSAMSMNSGMNNMSAGINNGMNNGISNNINNIGMAQNMNQSMGGMNQSLNNIGQSISGINQQINSMPQQLAAMNQQMGGMNQGMPGLNQQINQMSNMAMPINSMNQPMSKMNGLNPMMNGKVMYNLQNTPIQHYQEEDPYQYRYDQQRPRHT